MGVVIMEKLVNWCSQVVANSIFTKIIIGLILLNSVIIGMETYPQIYLPREQLFIQLDLFFLWAFTLEIVLRIMATKPKHHFFKDGWNTFDFIIVASGHLFAGAHFISVLRILRVLRVLRTISVIPSLQQLVNALLRTIPALGNIMFLLGLVFYIFAVIGTILFAHISPEYFGSLHTTLLTLFQVVTLESWASGVMRPLLTEAPWSWIYFVAFILVGTFVVVNLFIGVIVNNVQDAGICNQPADNNAQTTETELSLLRQEISQLKEMLVKMDNKQQYKG